MSAGPPNPPRPAQAKALNCPNCGAALTVRSFEHAVTIVCPNCRSILDAKDPNLKILQQFAEKTEKDTPLIPLGTKGTIRGAAYMVIGFQRRTILVEGTAYSWHEYLLFNPYKGFRYLTEYNGHWNDVSTLKALPQVVPGILPSVKYLGETYRHFQTSEAETTYVLGEFPWQVRVGEKVTVMDYVKPPRVLSSEKTGSEINWSMGEYMTGADVWKSFALPGSPPTAEGVYENQPSPMSAGTLRMWTSFAVLALLLFVVMVVMGIQSRDEHVFTGAYRLNTSAPVGQDASFVTDVFELQGHTSDVEVETQADVDNKWIYVNYALINADTGQAWDFGREVSYYHGYDSDGSWSEGSRSDDAVIPSVPPGRYYLRVEPESDRMRGVIGYTVNVKRDVPQFSFYGLGFLALLIPAVVVTWRSVSFEHKRWAESDHAPSGISLSGGGSGDDDD
ncbi:MAG: DUF4178 domain-containing protein [Terriglobales bacterium]